MPWLFRCVMADGGRCPQRLAGERQRLCAGRRSQPDRCHAPGHRPAGSAWLDFRLDLNADFDLTLAVNLGNRDADGADGLSIVLHNDPAGAAAVGNTSAGGEWVGLHGIQNALAVEIDTWQNATRGDPVCDHIGIDEIRNAASLPNHSGAGPECAETDGANIEDGAEHSVRLAWASTTRTLTVYWEGILRFTYTNTDIVNDIFKGASSVWFGVVGSTGGSYNLQQFRSIVTSGEICVTKSVAPTTIDPGDPLTYTVSVENNSAITTFVTQVEDQLPAGMTYLSGTTHGLTTADPAAAGQSLTWSGAWILEPGQSATLGFQVQGPMTPGRYLNHVIIRGSNFFEVPSGATAAVTVGSDLSTSTKTVADLNGGDPEPGDVLRYTITMGETAGINAAGIAVTDEIPANITGFTVTGIPAGAVNTSTGPGTGANGTGRLQVSNISVPANGSAAIVFEVTIDALALNRTAIDNTASVANPSGIGATPAASTVTVIDPAVPAIGTKPLYFYSAAGYNLSRTPPATSQPAVRLTDNGGHATWTLTPALAAPVTINGAAGVIPVEILLYCSGGGTRRQADVRLFSASSNIDTHVSIDQRLSTDLNNPTLVTFDIPVNGNISLPPGDALSVTVSNTTNRNNRFIDVVPVSGGNRSRVVLEADTVINVDQVAFYNAPYPAGTTPISVAPGQPIFIRAVVSDPFGSFDITSAALDLEMPNSTPVVSGTAMTEVADSGGAIKAYEYATTLPIGGPQGTWTATVTAREGSEALVKHSRSATVKVQAQPNLMLVKSAGGATANPGQIITYTIQLSNGGGTATDVVMEDHLSPYTALRIAYDGTAAQPFQLAPAGLGAAEYSHDSGESFNSNPLVSGAGNAPDGFDGTVSHWRIVMDGEMAGGEDYTIRYQVIIK